MNENNNDDKIDWDIYNNKNFIPFKTENGEIIQCSKPDFSKDKIVYQYGTEIPAFWVMDFDGSNKTKIYENLSIDYTFTGPKFHPSGERILFVSHYRNNETDLMENSIDILKKNGTEWNSNYIREQIYRMDNTIGKIWETSFNHNGSKIVYRLWGGIAGLGDIYIMDSDGTNHKRLTTHKGRDVLPTFSPDGSKIAWIHSDSGPDPEYIWIMNSDGSNKKCLTNKHYSNYVTFTPNGKILFESGRVSPHCGIGDEWNIWMMDADGSNQKLIVPSTFHGSTYNDDSAINSDNTMIVFDHGLISDPKGLYYVKDPDGDGIWEDSDGDGVADVCDGAPNDPDEGYIKDEKSNDDFICIFIYLSGVIIASVTILSRRKSK